jgi:hypothetical protein
VLLVSVAIHAFVTVVTEDFVCVFAAVQVLMQAFCGALEVHVNACARVCVCVCVCVCVSAMSLVF